MSLEALKNNVLQEKKLIAELISLEETKSPEERGLVENSRESIKGMLRILNNSIPSLVESISLVRRMPLEDEIEGGMKKEVIKNLVSIGYTTEGSRNIVTISKSDKREFIRNLKMGHDSFRKLRRKKEVEEKIQKFKKPSIYAKISNKIFLNLSSSLSAKGYFLGLRNDIKKANIPFMLNTYLSMAFLSTLISVFIGIALFAFFLNYNLSIESIIVETGDELLIRIVKTFWIILLVPALTFFSFYFYPSAEKDSIRKRVNLELPFVTIHMSAIAGSGIEPTQIFKIIVMRKEYKHTCKELMKVLNQVNVYGYDLVNALKNSASATASDKLADLLNGLATTISTGGDLPEFLDKRSETLLFEYKLDREKYNKVAETFMDIYISIIIAAPMIMMLLLILVSILPGSSIGMSTEALTGLIIGIVVLLNIFFLIFLQMKQREV